MELKMGYTFFGSIISHCECILAPFVVFSWYLIELRSVRGQIYKTHLNIQLFLNRITYAPQ